MRCLTTESWRRTLYVLNGLLLAYGMADILFHSSLFNASCQVSSNLQEHIMSYMDQIRFLSDFLVFYPLMFYLAYCVIFSQDAYFGALQIIGILFILLLDDYFKLIFFDGRPYYVCENVQAGSCSTDLGSPSGHMFSATCLYLHIYFYLIRPSTFMSRYPKAQVGVPVAILCLLGILAFTRIGLGVHTFSQTILGFLFGSTYFFLLHEICYPKGLSFANGHISTHSHRWYPLTKALLFIFINTGLVFLAFSDSVRSKHEEWAVELELKCDWDMADLGKSFQYEDLTQASLSSTGIGLLRVVSFPEKYSRKRTEFGFLHKFSSLFTGSNSIILTFFTSCLIYYLFGYNLSILMQEKLVSEQPACSKSYQYAQTTFNV